MIGLVINLYLVLIAIETIAQSAMGCTDEILVAIYVEIDCRILYKKSVVIAIDSHCCLWMTNPDSITISQNIEVTILLVESVVLVIVKYVHDYNDYLVVIAH